MTIERKRPKKTFRSFSEETIPDLFVKLEEICTRHGSTLERIYEHHRGQLAPSTRRARLAAFDYLVEVERRSESEVARMFDRDAATVHRALARYRRKGKPGPLPDPEEDLSALMTRKRAWCELGDQHQ